MHYIKNYLLLFIFLYSVSSFGQEIGEISLKKPGRSAGDMAAKKIKKAPKKIFIAEFNIFYQLVYADFEQSREGVHHGKTSATLTVAAPDIKKENLKELTNKLYKEYTQNLKSKGYQILPTSAAKGIKNYENWEIHDGGGLNEAQIKGYVMSTPDDYQYFLKKVNKKGREKKGFIDNSIKVSQQLDGVLVAKINIVIPFMKDSESGASKSASKILGGISKLVASPDLRLTSSSVASGYANGYSTQATYAYSTGMSEQAMVRAILKDDVPIPGVFNDEKFKAVAVTQLNQEYNTGAYTIIQSTDVNASNVQMAKCDSDKYNKGTYEASKSFLDASLERLYSFAEGK